jgi:hypothetical protein
MYRIFMGYPLGMAAIALTSLKTLRLPKRKTIQVGGGITGAVLSRLRTICNF